MFMLTHEVLDMYQHPLNNGRVHRKVRTSSQSTRSHRLRRSQKSLIFFFSLVAMTRNRILTDLVCNEIHLIPECLRCPYPLTSYQPGSYSVNINAGRINRGIIGINHLLQVNKNIL